MICHLCRSNKMTHLCRPHRGGIIYRCDNCSNACTIPRPQKVYEDDPFFEGTQNDQKLYKKYAQSLISFIEKKYKKGRILDIGTGGGCLMEEANKRGFKVDGIDPSHGAVAYCKSRGLSVIQGYLKEGIYKEKTFDIIVASHVLEHVADIRPFLKTVSKILKNNGVVILAQTNFTGTIPKLYGKYWEGWVPSQHFYHFSPNGIAKVLKMHGLKVEECMIIPLGYQLRWKWGGFPEVANNLYNSLSWLLSTLKIGHPFVGDQMYISARILSK